MAGKERRSSRARGGVNCWVIRGNDGLLIDRRLAEVVAGAGGEGVWRQTFWAPETAGKKRLARWGDDQRGRVSDALTSPSFFSSRTLVIVKGADRLHDEDLDSIASVFNAVEEGAGLVLVCANKTTEDRIKRRISRSVTVVTATSPSKEADVLRWIELLARELGHAIDTDACELLCDLVGENLLELRGQLEKVSIVIGKGGRIGPQEVARVVGESRVHDVWALVNAIGERDANQALRLAGPMVENTAQFPAVVGAIASAFRKMWLQKEETAATRGSGGGGGRSRYHDARRAARFNRAELAVALEALAQSDLAFKTGRGKPRWLLENFVLTMCRVPVPA